MNRLGIQSLNAGAPDLRLSGDHNRGSYVQRRRAQMAGGGIMGSNAGSMLVAPTADGSRPGYADWWNPFTWAEPIKEVAKKVGQTIIPGGETGYFDLYGGAAQAADVLKDVVNPADPSTWQTPPIAPNTEDIYQDKILRDLAKTPPKLTEQGTTNPLLDFLIKTGQTVMPGGEPGFIDLYGSGSGSGGGGGGDPSIFRQAANIGIPFLGGKWAHDYQRDWLAKQPPFPGDETGYAGGVGDIQRTARITPEAEAAAKGLFFTPQDKYRLRSPEQEQAILGAAEGGRIGYDAGGSYESIIKELMDKGLSRELAEVIAMSGLSSDRYDIDEKAQGGRIGYAGGGGSADYYADLYSKYAQEMIQAGKTPMPIEDFVAIMKEQGHAQGGRIGYQNGGNGDHPLHDDYWEEFDPDRDQLMASHEGNDAFLEQRYEYYLELGFSPRKAAEQAHKDLMEGNFDPGPYAKGGRVAAQEGGLMNLGGMEKDYREEGGFVPIGGQEKADDVPARLSKNEFVFTADAVRNAGGGDIDAGAKVMENLMNHLEAGGGVSEDSQGLEGARGMFANAQKLQNRII